jgi:hypothetical protein
LIKAGHMRRVPRKQKLHPLRPRSVVLDGCPMFALVYMGRKRILQMLSLNSQRFLPFAVLLPT